MPKKRPRRITAAIDESRSGHMAGKKFGDRAFARINRARNPDDTQGIGSVRRGIHFVKAGEFPRITGQEGVGIPVALLESNRRA
jgi:hypothetical protein